VAFESNSLVGVLAVVRAGLGVAALLPGNLEPAVARHDAGALPGLPTSNSVSPGTHGPGEIP